MSKTEDRSEGRREEEIELKLPPALYIDGYHLFTIGVLVRRTNERGACCDKR